MRIDLFMTQNKALSQFEKEWKLGEWGRGRSGGGESD